MNLRKLIDKVTEHAPLLAGAIGGPAGAAVSLIADAFGGDRNTDALAERVAGDPDAALKLRQIENDHRAELARIAMQREANELAADTARIESVNKTMRAEAASCDPFTRRWRPMFGYVVCVSWFLQMTAIAVLMLTRPAAAAAVISSMAELTVLWGVALSVLGVSVAKRSQDKQVAAGLTPAPGIAGAVASMITRGRGKDA